MRLHAAGSPSTNNGRPPAEAMLAIFLPQGLPALRREIGESTVEGLTAPVVTTKIMDVSGSPPPPPLENDVDKWIDGYQYLTTNGSVAVSSSSSATTLPGGRAGQMCHARLLRAQLLPSPACTAHVA